MKDKDIIIMGLLMVLITIAMSINANAIPTNYLVGDCDGSNSIGGSDIDSFSSIINGIPVDCGYDNNGTYTIWNNSYLAYDFDGSNSFGGGDMDVMNWVIISGEIYINNISWEQTNLTECNSTGLLETQYTTPNGLSHPVNELINCDYVPNWMNISETECYSNSTKIVTYNDTKENGFGLNYTIENCTYVAPVVESSGGSGGGGIDTNTLPHVGDSCDWDKSKLFKTSFCYCEYKDNIGKVSRCWKSSSQTSSSYTTPINRSETDVKQPEPIIKPIKKTIQEITIEKPKSDLFWVIIIIIFIIIIGGIFFIYFNK